MASISAHTSRTCVKLPLRSQVIAIKFEAQSGKRELNYRSQVSRCPRHIRTSATSKNTSRSSLSGGLREASGALVRRSSLRRQKVRVCAPTTLQTRLTTSRLGRWPEKSVKFITRLLKNAESNADAKSIDVEDLVIKSIVVQQAPVRITCDHPLFRRFLNLLSCRKPVAGLTGHTVVSTRTRATLAMSRSSSSQLM